MIELDKVSKFYKKGSGTHALEELSFRIDDGEFVFIIGDSGAGKTTLVRLLMGMERPTAGTVTVDGVNVSTLSRLKLPRFRRRFGVIFQDFRLLQDYTVYENVAFAQRVVNTSRKTIQKRVPKVLADVGLEDKLNHKPSQLSGGEQQRTAIARAMVNGPLYLIADEPTGNLDPANSEEVMRLLEGYNRMGTTVIVITHDAATVNRMKKRVITLKNGRLVSDRQEGGYGDAEESALPDPAGL